jgi:hypothetical protein
MRGIIFYEQFFDNKDSLDQLEFELIIEESGVKSQGCPIAVPTLVLPGGSSK